MTAWESLFIREKKHTFVSWRWVDIFLPLSHQFLLRKIPLTLHHIHGVFQQRGFQHKVLMPGHDCPHLLLSNRPIVSHHLCTSVLLSEPGCSLLAVCLCATQGPLVTETAPALWVRAVWAVGADQRSQPSSPRSTAALQHFRVFPLTFSSQQTPTQQKARVTEQRRSVHDRELTSSSGHNGASHL